MQEFLSYFQIPDANILARILLSIVLGFGIGFERELTNKWAGLRTHILVSLGSCLFTIVSIYGFSTSLSLYPMGDPGRVAAQIVTGIGFIGGGTVLRQGSSVYGLTTAATLWMVASIGMACGCGKFNWAIVSAVLSIAVLVLIRIFEREIMPRNLKNQKKLKVVLYCEEEMYSYVRKKIHTLFPDIIELNKKKTDDENLIKIVIRLAINCKNPIECVHEKIDDINYIKSVSVQEIYE